NAAVVVCGALDGDRAVGPGGRDAGGAAQRVVPAGRPGFVPQAELMAFFVGVDHRVAADQPDLLGHDPARPGVGGGARAGPAHLHRLVGVPVTVRGHGPHDQRAAVGQLVAGRVVDLLVTVVDQPPGLVHFVRGDGVVRDQLEADGDLGDRMVVPVVDPPHVKARPDRRIGGRVGPHVLAQHRVGRPVPGAAAGRGGLFIDLPAGAGDIGGFVRGERMEEVGLLVVDVGPAVLVIDVDVLAGIEEDDVVQ